MTEPATKTSVRRACWFVAGGIVAAAVVGGAAWAASDARTAALLAVFPLAVAAGLALGWILGARRAATPAPAPPSSESEAARTDYQKFLARIIDSMEGGVMTISSEGTITSFNPVAQDTLGWDTRDVVGRHFSTVLGDHPANQALGKMIASALTKYQTFSSVEVSAATRAGEPVALGATISLLRDESGRPHGLVLTFKNLAELKRLREQVQRTDQLASLGRLAAGMAHEIRNPLGSLRGLVELIQEDFAAEDPKRRYTGTILRTIDRLNALVESLLEFSHPPMTNVEPHDVKTLVRESAQFCALEHRGRPVRLDEAYPDEPIPVLADSETLSRAFINIVRNAFQATPDGGTVTVAVNRCAARMPDAPAQAVVRISNTGSYIKPADLKKLFTPFFTTKPAGTGLGLAIANQILSAHSGQIEVESELDSGTTFNIMLPVA